MAKIPAELRYTKDHEWIKVEGDVAFVGITDHAQHAMGDIVYVELPEVDAEIEAHGDLCVVESVKGANDVFCPASGKVVEINEALDDSPELLNQDAYANWIAKIELKDASELDSLLTPEDYAKLVEEAEAE